jgi:hypothetical protein
MRQQAEIEQQEARQAFVRRQVELDAQTRLETARRDDARRQEHLSALRAMGVDLTAYLTQARADRVVEVRGAAGTHLHLSPDGQQAPPAEKPSA